MLDKPDVPDTTTHATWTLNQRTDTATDRCKNHGSGALKALDDPFFIDFLDQRGIQGSAAGDAATQPVDWQPPMPFTKTQEVPPPPVEVAELMAEETELAVWAV